MELDLVRKKLNCYDNIIKNMINLRMSLIPIVADIKIKNNMPFVQGKREAEIYRNIEIFAEENGIDANLIKDIYKLMITNAVKLEKGIAEEKVKSVLNENIDISRMEGINQDFEKLDKILENEIPEILSSIKEKFEKENLNMNQISTLYYNGKVGN